MPSTCRIALANAHTGDGLSSADRKSADIASRLDLSDVLDVLVRELSYGKKRQLEVALALCPSPKVLLLDEPAAGTSPDERKKLIALIRSLPPQLTLLLVEHDMDVVFELCTRITRFELRAGAGLRNG